MSSTLIRNLVGGSVYVFRVSALNNFGYGPWSQFVSWRLAGGGGVKCALPQVPASAAAGGSSALAGYKFGAVPDSRLEFAKVSGIKTFRKTLVCYNFFSKIFRYRTLFGQLVPGKNQPKALYLLFAFFLSKSKI